MLFISHTYRIMHIVNAAIKAPEQTVINKICPIVNSLFIHFQQPSLEDRLISSIGPSINFRDFCLSNNGFAVSLHFLHG